MLFHKISSPCAANHHFVVIFHHEHITYHLVWSNEKIACFVCRQHFCESKMPRKPTNAKSNTKSVRNKLPRNAKAKVKVSMDESMEIDIYTSGATQSQTTSNTINAEEKRMNDSIQSIESSFEIDKPPKSPPEKINGKNYYKLLKK